MESKKELKKNLGVATAMSVVVGCVIGSGVFFKPQAIYTATGGAPGLGMLAWIITGLASIAAALTFAEIAIMIPKTGGIVAYLEEAFNPPRVSLRLGADTVVLSGNDLGFGGHLRSAGSAFRRRRIYRSACDRYHHPDHLFE